MSNRTGKLRSPSITRNSVNEGNAKVAAKTADIKLFSELLSEKKRLNERTNEHHNDEMFESTQPIADPNLPNTHSTDFPDYPRFVDPVKLDDNLRKQVTDRSAPQLEMSLKATQTATESQQAEKIDITPLVSVVQRIIANHANAKEPKQWLIKLSLNDQRSIDISLEYLGNNEWRIGMREDDGKNESRKNESDNTPSHDSLDELYIRVEAELVSRQPDLRISPSIQGPL